MANLLAKLANSYRATLSFIGRRVFVSTWPMSNIRSPSSSSLVFTSVEKYVAAKSPLCSLVGSAQWVCKGCLTENCCLPVT